MRTATAFSSPEDLSTLAEHYVSDLPSRPKSLRDRRGTKDVVLVTGTTGNFGGDLLETLLREDTVGMVYALNRQHSQALQRQKAAFHTRGFDSSLLETPRFKMIEGDLSLPNFGIQQELFIEMRETVTCIIHNAWRVNFNYPVSTFDIYLAALRGLIDFALSSPFTVPPKIQFISSIAVLQNYDMPCPVPEEPLDPASAIGTGYGESKWVAERMLFSLAEQTDVPVQIVRLGQICGEEGGYWKKDEWFPAIVGSASLTRCLPDVDGDAAFVPNYPGARAVVEMRTSPYTVMHLVHPRPIRLRTLVTSISDELGIPLVPYASWLHTLEDSARSIANDYKNDKKSSPAIGLMDFFRAVKFSQGNEMAGLLELSTENARAASVTLEHLPELDEDVAIRWMEAWRAEGFLDN